MTAFVFRYKRRPRTLPAHSREHTAMVANSHTVLRLRPMNVQRSSACSSRISKPRNIRWWKRVAAVEARSSHRAMVLRERPVTRAVAEMLLPSTRRLATWSNSLRLQRRPAYTVPVCVLSVCPHTVQRYRRRRPDFVANEPWPTMLRPGFPKLSHPSLAHAISSIAFIAQVYRGAKPVVSPTTSEGKVTDLDRSPFQGEGHRKVHARLRILDGIRVARTRVLRVMRAHKLLSPHRGRQGAARVHAGTIVTQAPNVMWGTDGVRVFTLDDGWGWIFTAVEHWNAECVGWHVCKVGSRFAALEPIAQGLRRIYGALDADSARGLALRMDHGSQYLSDHFLNQIRYWGIRPSYGFVEEPETNGVAERWNRTLKEQAIHGRIFQNLKEVRAAVTAFVERYNTTWRLEKLGYHTPIEAREAHELRRAA